MRIVIAGAGTLGRRVAQLHARRARRAGHRAVARAGARRRRGARACKVLVGDADEPAVLLRGRRRPRRRVRGLDRRTTKTTWSASLLAKNEYKVRKVIAAVRNPRNRWLYNRSWGVDVAIDSAEIVTKLIEEEATLADVVTPARPARGRGHRVVDDMTEGGHWAAGKTMRQLGLPEGCCPRPCCTAARCSCPGPRRAHRGRRRAPHHRRPGRRVRPRGRGLKPMA